MGEYYAVQRSTDHLAHYGVKGMKWGVRKAIATRNQKALDRHFQKAAKKLAKLQDIGLNNKKYAAKALAYGAAAAGTGTIAVKGIARLKKVDLNNPKTYPSKFFVNLVKNNNKVRVGAAALTAGLGTASAVNAYRSANSAKYRQKAIDFRNEMNKAFAGTKYEGQYVALPKTRKRRRK